MTSTRQMIYQQFERWLPWLLFFFGVWYFCLRILGPNLEFILGDFIDARFINFLLEHGYQWSIGNSGSFWNAGYMYPSENVVALSDSMLGTIPFYGIWRLFGFNQETSYQLWWIVICSLNYWVTYIVVKRWFNRTDLALIAAWIFAFTLFNFGQFSYEQMIIRFPIPIVIYSATKLMEGGKVRHFALLAFGLAYQFYAVMYTGFFLMYFVFLYMLIYCVAGRKFTFYKPLFRKENIRYTILVLSGSISSMLWLFIPYIEIAPKVSFHEYSTVIGNVPTFKSFLFPHESSVLWGFAVDRMRPEGTDWWLHYTFAGIIPLIGILCGPILWIYWKVKGIKASVLQKSITITVVLICLFFVRTPDGKSLYFIFFHLPGIGSLRVLNRFMHVALFFAIISFLLLVMKRIPNGWGYLLIILAILDNSFDSSKMYRSSKAEEIAMRANIDEEVKQHLKPEHIAFAIINDGDDNWETCVNHVDAMNASLDNHIPTINGYSSSCTGEYWRFMGQNTKENLYFWLRYNNIDSTKVLIIDHTSGKD